ncbi:amidophosphoribosyltransferase [candidate division KSB1 bacterium]|nr:amidophosphoribosyltransferase [candidate division KSB1 bacterium]RQV99962.1 MAG: amidophosphoribosyltransferase [candidate division KSB1 bacterium]
MRNLKKKIIDKPESNCGTVAVFDHPEAAYLAYLALYALQHRGQESAGIVSSDGDQVYHHIGRGVVADVFSDQKKFEGLKGHIAIGHNRYSTTGSTSILNAQPLVVKMRGGSLAVSHNGNFTNSGTIRRMLVEQGAIFQTSTDTEVLVHLIARSQKAEMAERITEALQQIRGAYSITMMMKDKIYAMRDPDGVRPLCLGKKDGAYFVVSETCALDLIRAHYVRDVQPGELVEISNKGIESCQFATPTSGHKCIFEFVYFSRPDSQIFSENVDKVRRKMGKNLALESPADADIVISVPDSSNTAAVGYSRRSDLKFELGLIRNHYIGRTFISPQQRMRDFAVRVKFNPVRGILNNRRVVVVEDSIVRGTTLRQLVKLIRQAGAREVHVRVSSPPITSPCYYGMDFPSKSELIANKKTVAEISEFLGCDSLAYLSIEKLLESVPHETGGYCTACFTGNYPIEIEEKIGKFQHE